MFIKIFLYVIELYYIIILDEYLKIVELFYIIIKDK